MKNMKLSGKTIAFKQKLFTNQQSHFGRHGISSKKVDYRKVFSDLKNNFSISEIKSILQSIAHFRNYDRYIWGAPLPKTYSELRSTKLLYFSGSIEKELNWSFINIEKFINPINKFLGFKEEYESALVASNYNEAETILDLIEQEVCMSLWSIEQRLLLAEYKDGLKGNKEVLSQINSTTNNNTVSILADFFSKRVEKKMSVSKYEDRVNRYLAKFQGNNQSAFLYFGFKLKCHEYYLPDQVSYIICFENNSSIIDRYLTFIRICKIFCSEKEETNQKKIIRKYLNVLSSKLDDYNLKSMELLLKPDLKLEPDNLSNIVMQIADRYTEGDYRKSYESSKEVLLKYPHYFGIYEFYLKSLINISDIFEPINESYTIANFILKGMYYIYIKEDESNEDFNSLSKIANELGNTDFSLQLYSFLLEELSSLDSQKFELNSVLSNRFISARFAKTYNELELSSNYLENIKTIFNSSVTVDFWLKYYSALKDLNVADFGENIPIDRKIVYQGYIYEYHGLFEKAIEIYETILKSKVHDSVSKYKKYIYKDIVKRLYDCYLQQSNIKRCIEIAVDNYLINPFIISKFNLDKIIRLQCTTSDEGIIGSLNWPMIIYINNAKDTKSIYAAYDDFLCFNDRSKPSELEEIEKNFEKKKLVFFLKHICVAQVMYNSIAFNNREEIQKERIAICQYLIKLDEKDKKLYSDEISLITQKIMIKKRMQQIADSKIYVDVNGIKNDIELGFIESFNRYKEFSSFSKRSFIRIFDTTIFEQVKKGDFDSIINDIVLSFNKDPKYILFKEMFYELRDRFISSNEYGLDSFLSLRIRHGTLLNQLRKQFVDSHLMTPKDKLTESYIENEFWNSKLNFLNQEKMGKIQLRLAEFSRSIDDIILNLRSNWIQIRSEDKNEQGLFDFTFSETYLFTLFRKLGNIDKHDIFMEKIFDELWKRTEEDLEIIRPKIENELSDIFIEYLNTLEADIKEITNNGRYNGGLSELYGTITTCRTNIQNELNKISEWFNISEDKEVSDFNITQLVQTCSEIINNIYSFFKVVPNISIGSSSLIKGQYFAYFVDMLLILLDNIVKHSDVDMHKLDISIDVKEIDNKLFFRVTNNLAESKIGHIKSMIEGIKKDLISNNNTNKIRMEGGSGYYKIIKILQYDLNRKDFGIDFNIEDNDYAVNIYMGMEDIIADGTFDC